MEFFDRQDFSKHWPHREIIKEISGAENNGNHSQKQSNSDPALCFPTFPQQEPPRLMKKSGLQPCRAPVNAEGDENDSNTGVQRENVSARSRTNWEGVNLSACFLSFTLLVLSFSTWHLCL